MSGPRDGDGKPAAGAAPILSIEDLEISFRVGGELKALKTEPLSNEDIEAMVEEILKPEQLADFQQRGTLDLARLLPPEPQRQYFTYMGSLTTPPCSEGVLWMVMKQPVPISPEQIGIFARLYPMNARPVQSAAGRLIKESE